MKSRIIFIVFIVFVFSQCRTSNTNTIDEVKCKQMSMKASEMFNNYFMIDNEQSYVRLDSALSLIDTMFLCNCNVRKFNLVANKVIILSIKRDFPKALKFIKKTNDTLFLAPYLKSVYLKRIEAMEAQDQNDIVTRNNLIRGIVIELKNYLPFPSSEIDSVLSSNDVQNIYQYEKHLAICQYYFYRAQLEGTDKIINELDSLKQSINGNHEFFDFYLKNFIKQDFMLFEGF